MNSKELTSLFLLAAMWGTSFIFIKIGATALGPFMTIELRVLIAGLALLAYSMLIKQKLYVKKYWKEYIILGALNSALPFSLIAFSTVNLNASLASILNSTTPMFSALVALVWLKEKFTVKKFIGILTGIIGVVILIGFSPLPVNLKTILSAGMSVLAALSYAVGAAFVKKRLSSIETLTLATVQQLAAALVLLPLAAFNLPKGEITLVVVSSILTLALMCTSAAYLIYFYLISKVGPTKTLSVTYLVPVFGMIWSFIFLKEQITFGVIMGLIIILISITLIADVKFQKEKFKDSVTTE